MTDAPVAPTQEFLFYAANTDVPTAVARFGVQIIYPYDRVETWDPRSATWLLDVRTHQPSNLCIGDEVTMVAPANGWIRGYAKRWNGSENEYASGVVYAFFRVRGKLGHWKTRSHIEGTFCALWNQEAGGWLHGHVKDIFGFSDMSKKIGLFWVGCLRKSG